MAESVPVLRFPLRAYGCFGDLLLLGLNIRNKIEFVNDFLAIHTKTYKISQNRQLFYSLWGAKMAAVDYRPTVLEQTRPARGSFED